MFSGQSNDDTRPIDDFSQGRQGCAALNTPRSNYYYYPDVKESKEEIIANSEYAYTAVCRGKRLENAGSAIEITLEQHKKITDDLTQYMLKAYDMTRKMAGYIADNVAYMEKHKDDIDAYWASRSPEENQDKDQRLKDVEDTAIAIQKQLYTCLASEFQTNSGHKLELDMEPKAMQERAAYIARDMSVKLKSNPQLMQNILYRSVNLGCGNLDLIIEQAEAQFYPAMATIQRQMREAKEFGAGGVTGYINWGFKSATRFFASNLKRVSSWLSSFSGVTIGIVLQQLALLGPVVNAALEAASWTNWFTQLPAALVCGAGAGLLQYFTIQYTFAQIDKALYQKQRNDPALDPRASKMLDMFMEKCAKDPKKFEDVGKIGETLKPGADIPTEQRQMIKSKFSELAGAIPSYIWSGLIGLVRIVLRTLVTIVVMTLGSMGTVACQSMLGGGLNRLAGMVGLGAVIPGPPDAAAKAAYDTAKSNYANAQASYVKNPSDVSKSALDQAEKAFSDAGEKAKEQLFADKAHISTSIFDEVQKYNEQLAKKSAEVNSMFDEARKLNFDYEEATRGLDPQVVLKSDTFNNMYRAFENSQNKWKIEQINLDKMKQAQGAFNLEKIAPIKEEAIKAANAFKANLDADKARLDSNREYATYTSMSDNVITRKMKDILSSSVSYIKGYFPTDPEGTIYKIFEAMGKGASYMSESMGNASTYMSETRFGSAVGSVKNAIGGAPNITQEYGIHLAGLLGWLSNPAVQDVGATLWLSTFLAISYLLSDVLLWMVTSGNEIPEELTYLKPHRAAPKNIIIPTVKQGNTMFAEQESVRQRLAAEAEAYEKSLKETQAERARLQAQLELAEKRHKEGIIKAAAEPSIVHVVTTTKEPTTRMIIERDMTFVKEGLLSEKEARIAQLERQVAVAEEARRKAESRVGPAPVPVTFTQPPRITRATPYEFIHPELLRRDVNVAKISTTTTELPRSKDRFVDEGERFSQDKLRAIAASRAASRRSVSPPARSRSRSPVVGRAASRRSVSPPARSRSRSPVVKRATISRRGSATRESSRPRSRSRSASRSVSKSKSEERLDELEAEIKELKASSVSNKKSVTKPKSSTSAKGKTTRTLSRQRPLERAEYLGAFLEDEMIEAETRAMAEEEDVEKPRTKSSRASASKTTGQKAKKAKAPSPVLRRSARRR